MSTPALPERCPSCAGPLLTDHPGGLVLQHQVTCPLLRGEDATRAADVERIDEAWGPLVRLATATERTLLAADPDLEVTVVVREITPGVLRRDFEEHAPITTTEEDPR